MKSFTISQKKDRNALIGNRKKEWIWAYGLIAIPMIYLLVFSLISIFAALGVSLTDWRLISAPNFIGLENYQKLFNDSVFLQAMLNTAIYTFLSVPVGVFIALLLAIVLNQKIRGLPFFRVMYYSPAISASVAVAMVWMWIYSSNYGVLNYILGLFGIEPVDWLNNSKTALLAITTVTIWKDLGFKVIIFLAALQEVPQDVLEAAEVDGANWWRRFTRVIIPLISPIIFYISVTSFIGATQSMDLMYNMRFEHDGGPARATTKMAFYIYQVSFEYLRMGYGTTMAVILFLIIIVVTYIQWHFRKRFIYLEE